MNAAKWVVALGLLASGSVAAQDTVYDYQGAVMTGLGAPETLTAQLEFFGPVTDRGTEADISVRFSGTQSGLYFSENCVIANCASPGVPLELQINQTHGKFVSAYLSLQNAFQDGDTFFIGNMAIGPTRDRLDLFDENNNDKQVVSVASSTPGVWREASVRAPELNTDGTLSAMTLLAGCLLILTGKRRPIRSAVV
jgi:hypothetical protein